MIREATSADISAVAEIYEEIHTQEEAGRAVVGWVRGIYPTRKTAEAAVANGDLYVLEAEGRVAAAARINREQAPEYALADWKWEAARDEALVLHTLVVSPTAEGRGYGKAFVQFYEELAKELGCPCLRMDTNEKNSRARRFYKNMGYREAGIVPCVFNGIGGVRLVCLEKKPEMSNNG